MVHFLCSNHPRLIFVPQSEEIIMTDIELKENAVLNDDQLTEVTGGNATVGRYHFTGHVLMRKGVVGRNYYVVKDDGTTWYYGQLLKSHDNILGGRIHYVYCTLKDGEQYGHNMQFFGDDYSLYTKMTEG